MSANSGGITGRSTAGCVSCHGTAFNYTASINDGASTVAPNSATSFTVQMNGAGATAGGFNMSVLNSDSAASLSDAVDAGTQALDGELTHTTPRVATQPAWTIRLNSGANVGTATLRVCVNPVNDDGLNNASDGSSNAGACTTRNITVNRAPNANNDSFSVDEDSGLSAVLNLLGDDTSGSSSNDGGDSINIDRIENSAAATVDTGNGTVTRSGNTVRYTPDANFNGTDSFTYRIIDSQGATATATVTMTVASVNDEPTLNANGNTGVSEDPPTPQTVNLSGIGSGAANESQTLTVTASSSNPGLIPNPTVTYTSANSVGSLSYMPVANQSGSALITVTVMDNGGTANGGDNTVQRSFTITVSPTNDTPTAVADSATVDEDSSGNALNVLLNDTDIDVGDSKTITAVGVTSNGGVVSIVGASANNTLSYTPAPGFVGIETFMYTMSDSGLATSSALVTVTVSNVDDAPVAGDDGFTLDEDSSDQLLAVLGNDSDADAGDSLTVTQVNGGAVATCPSLTAITNGNICRSSASTNNSLSFTPTPDFAGVVTFAYTVEDSTSLTDSGAVTVTVGNLADAPVAEPDMPSVARGSTGNSLDVLLNDRDPDNQSAPVNAGLSVSAATLETGETLMPGEAVAAAGDGLSVVYTPPSNFSGTRLLRYTVSDGGATTANALVTVTVISGTAPVAVADGPFAVAEDSLASTPANIFDVLANDTDPDFDTLTAVVTQAPLNGVLSGSGGSLLSYQPNANFTGSDSFRYRARDTALLQSANEITVSITVTAAADSPVAVADALSVARGTSGNALDVLANDTDPDNIGVAANTDLSVSAASIPAGLSPGEAISVSAGGIGVSYTPPSNFSGVRTLSYTITDGGLSASAQVTVTVADGSAPVAVADGPFTVTEDSLASTLANAFNVLANDSDADNDTLSIVVTQIPANGVMSGNGGTLLTYQPNADFVGADSFRYRARDSASLESGEVSVSINVTAADDAPVAVNDSLPLPPLMLREDQGPFTLDVLANDTDVDAGDTRTVTAVTQGSEGAVVAVSAATTGNAVGYTPATDFNGTETFTYTLQDSAGLSDTGTVSVIVMPVNDAPMVTSTAVTVASDAVPFQYAVAQSDVDDSTFIYALSGAPTTGTPMSISAAGLITWTPPVSTSLASYTVGPITVTVTDTGGGEGVNLSATQTFSITVNAPDGDGDGIPNGYETANGFDPASAVDATLDRDGDGRSNLAEFQQGTNPDADDVVPRLTLPAAVQVNATGFLTAVNLGTAQASDVKDGVRAVVGPTPRGPFRPGRYAITYSSTDRAGNTATDTQRLDVLPLVELGADAISGEGRSISVPVILSGTAPVYPVRVNYTVSGTAGSADHDAVSGTLSIASGTQGSIEIAIAGGDAAESDETLVLTLSSATGAATGTRLSQTTTIVDRNVAPEISLDVRQWSGQLRTQVFANQGPVTVTVVAVDPNPGDVLSFDFAGTAVALSPPAAGASSSFDFDPAGLPPGRYLVRVRVSDAAGAASTVETSILLQASAPTLTTADSDGDDVDDASEGFADADGDGIADFLDRFADVYVLPDQTGQTAQSRMLETESGLALRIGPTAIAAGGAGALISLADVVSLGEGAGPVSNASDTLENNGGLFDFEITGLVPGGSAFVVIPLQSALRSGAVWRKYRVETGWRDFSSDANNAVASSAAIGGQCPAPGSTRYTPGLTALHSCVRLRLQDGGPNDADGQVNGRVRDPGGAAVTPTSVAADPPTGKSGGGGAIGLYLLAGLWSLACVSLYRRRRRSA